MVVLRRKLKLTITRRRLIREIATWTFCLGLAFGILTYIFVNTVNVVAGITPLSSSGAIFYGDTTTAGSLRARLFTNPSTWAAEITPGTSSASNILHVVAKTAPTREEIMIGHIKVDGRLDIFTCTTACDAAGDYTNRWNNPGTSATQDCDTAPTVGTCNRPFDIGYLPLNGQAMVAYGDNAADLAYYALWDGSSWSPNASPGSPGVSNQLNLPGTAGTPRWIRVIVAGDDLSYERSNRAMVLVGDSNDDLHAFYWDGSSFDGGTTLDSALQLTGEGQPFDGAWTSNGRFVVVYDDTAANNIRYRIYTVGSGWDGGESTATTTNSAGAWLMASADPTSSRIYVSSAADGNDTRGVVWRADDATDGWTACSNGDPNCPELTLEAVGARQASSAFERFNGEALHVYNNAGAANSDLYWTYTPTATWSNAQSDNVLASTDDALTIQAWGHPNDNDVMTALVDGDCDIDAALWNGSAMETGTGGLNLETSASAIGVACPGTFGNPVDGMTSWGFDFTWKMYTAWQRNWRFYADDTSSQTPSTALAAENTAPSSVVHGTNVRLRINYADRGRSISNTDARKKLQYTVGCNPNSALESDCNWVDVDDPGGNGVWRYTASASCGTCTDNTAIPSTLLTGSSSCASAGQGCGTFTLDKDSATVSNMDHNVSSSADIVQEAEYIIESIGAAANTTYYFRIWNVDQQTPVFREQDASDCGGGAAACNYPSLTTGAGPANTDTLRHGNWWSSGGEQTYFWVFFTVPAIYLRRSKGTYGALRRFKP